MRQKGQTLIEFAFVAPIVVFLFLSILYFGTMFMEYIQYNNAARDAARDISLLQSTGSRTAAVERINAENFTETAWFKNRYAPITKLYKSSWHAAFLDGTKDADGKYNESETEEDESVDVMVTIKLTRAAPVILGYLPILPEELKTIEYIMKLEKKTI